MNPVRATDALLQQASDVARGAKRGGRSLPRTTFHRERHTGWRGEDYGDSVSTDHVAAVPSICCAGLARAEGNYLDGARSCDLVPSGGLWSVSILAARSGGLHSLPAGIPRNNGGYST